MSARSLVWERVAEHDRERRGFDHPDGWLAQFALPSMAADATDARLSRQAAEEDIRGSFEAIAEMAGWWARMQQLDPADTLARAKASVAAEDLENMARGLRVVLDTYNEKETTP